VSKSVVIIPTYNEIENIEKMIRKVMSLQPAFELLIVDDGSPDGPAAVVRDFMANEFAGRLHFLERWGQLGLGIA